MWYQFMEWLHRYVNCFPITMLGFLLVVAYAGAPGSVSFGLPVIPAIYQGISENPATAGEEPAP